MQPVIEIESVGQRIRRWRRRRGGMSQRVLADLAGISQPYLSQLESGTRALDRRATQVAIAGALNISVAQLLGRPGEPGDPVTDRATRHVPSIRAALIEIGAGETRSPGRSVDDVKATVHEITDRRNAADYATMASQLPDLLYDLAAHDGAVAAETIETLFAARYALKTMGFVDLGRQAAELGVRLAERYEHPAWLGQARYSYVQALPPESAALGQRLTGRAADELQARPGRDCQEVYGCLHILSGFEAAIAGRPAEAWAHLGEAADVARTLGEPARTGDFSAGFNGNFFGPTQVEIWRVAIAAELGDIGAAQAVAARVDLDAMPVPNRLVYFWTDMARTLASASRDGDAMQALGLAERAAPQHFRLNPIARELVRSIIGRAKRRAVSEDMAGLARKLGIHPI